MWGPKVKVPTSQSPPLQISASSHTETQLDLERHIKLNSGNVRSRSSLHVNRCVINRWTKSLQKRNAPVCHLRHVDHRDILLTAAPSVALFFPCRVPLCPPPAQLASPPSRPGVAADYSVPSAFPDRRHYRGANTPAFGCGWLLTCSARAWTRSRGLNTNKYTIKFKANSIHCKKNK